MNILTAVLEADDDCVNNGGLVELEFVADILEKLEGTLSDWGTMINYMLEGAKINSDDQFRFDWSLFQS